MAVRRTSTRHGRDGGPSSSSEQAPHFDAVGILGSAAVREWAAEGQPCDRQLAGPSINFGCDRVAPQPEASARKKFVIAVGSHSVEANTYWMSKIYVREADEDDEPVLARIFRRASLSNAGDRDALLAHPEALTLPDDLLYRGRTRVATFADGTVVGFVTTRPTDPGVLELDDLFVDPDAMHRGVARQLILRIAMEAAGEDVARIDVTANFHALGFYAAVGFVAGARVDTEFGPGQRMHLDVAAVLRAHAPADSS